MADCGKEGHECAGWRFKSDEERAADIEIMTEGTIRRIEHTVIDRICSDIGRNREEVRESMRRSLRFMFGGIYTHMILNKKDTLTYEEFRAVAKQMKKFYAEFQLNKSLSKS